MQIPVARAHGPLRVPEITILFWVVKLLSTAMGESTSDYLVHALSPVVAVLIGFAGFAVAMAIQFSRGRYLAWSYWFAVVMIGVFGTMVADVLHVGFGVPYQLSAALFAVLLAANFVVWGLPERSLSIHTIDSMPREFFYWMTVVLTFALGTAVGDLTAIAFHLGYLLSAVLFTVIIAIPAVGAATGTFNRIFAFWFAYVATRPLGASVADWLGKPTSAGGLDVGSGPVAIVLSIAIVAIVAYLSISRRDVQAHDSLPESLRTQS